VTRSQRRWHVFGWAVLGPLMLVGLLTGWFARPTSPIVEAPVVKGTP